MEKIWKYGFKQNEHNLPKEHDKSITRVQRDS